MKVPGCSSAKVRPHAHKRYAVLSSRFAASSRPHAGPIATGADDDIGAAYCEGFDPQCGEDLEISRGPSVQKRPGP